MRGARFPCARVPCVIAWLVLLAMFARAAPAYAEEEGDEKPPVKSPQPDADAPEPPRLPPADGTPLPGPVEESGLPDRLLGPRGAEREARRTGPTPDPSTDPSLMPGPPLYDRDGIPLPGGSVPALPLPLIPRATPEQIAELDLWRRRWAGALDRTGPRHPKGLRGLPVHGRLRLRYRGRTATNYRDDHDLYQSLAIEAGDAYGVGWYGSFNARLAEDLNEFGTGSGFSFFSSIADTEDDRVTSRIYHAYIGYRPCDGLIEDVRIGRQDIDAGEFLYMDGILVQTRAVPSLGNARLHAFGGLPASYFEDATSGDFLGGFGIEAPLDALTTARLDYVYINDENGFYGAEDNNLVTAEIRRRLAPDALGWIRYSHLNGDPNELEVVYDGPLVRPDVTMRARWKTLLTAQGVLTYGLDPYAVITQALEPYHEGSVSVAKAFGRHHFVEGGAAGRWLKNKSDEGRYNREFQRLYITFGSKDWPRKHWSLGLTGDLWTGDDTIGSLGAQVEYKPSSCWRMRLGTDFQRYRTDFYRDEERLDSRSVFLDARYRPQESWSFHTRVRWEDDDFTTAWLLDMSAEFRF
jgi:hypothetical protein